MGRWKRGGVAMWKEGDKSVVGKVGIDRGKRGGGGEVED